MVGKEKQISLSEHSVYAVTTTVGSAEDAQRLAQLALEAHLAACVQIEPMTAHYRWQGALHADAEWRLVCKTTQEGVEPLLRLLQAQHPYELPQLVAQPLQASSAYADWVRQEVRAAG